MRTLATLTAVALSLIGSSAIAGEYTCTCLAADRTCSLRWGRDNNVRNVAKGTVLTRMQRVEYKVGIGAPGGATSGHLFQGPFAVDAYGNDPSEGDIPPQTTVRIEHPDNLPKWQCIEEKPPPPPPSASTPSTETIDVTSIDGMGRQPLYRAARDGDEVLVRKMIAAGANIGNADSEGDTAMHVAVRNGHVAAVKFLIEAGADPNQVSSKDGRPPLHVAMDKRAVDMVGQLLDQGAKPNADTMFIAASSGMPELIEPQLAKGGDVQIALKVLVDKKNTSLLEALLARGFRPNDDVVRAAAGGGDATIIEAVLQGGGDATVVLDYAMEQKDAKLATLALAKGAKPGDWLGEAVIMEDLGLVTAMLGRGASAQSGMTAAVNTGQIDMARLLLDHRASGGPPSLIAMAAGRSDLPMVTLLLDHGAVADNGMEVAAEKGFAAVVALLLERGADGTQGQHMAAASGSGHAAVVDLLIGAGGPPGPGMVPGCKGGHDEVLVRLISAGGDATSEGCMVGAVQENHHGVVKLLLQHDARIDWRVGRKDETLLHLAAANASYDMAQVLLEAGASVEDTDKDGETALHSAGRKKDNVGVIELLIRNGADINALNDKGKSVYKVANGGQNKKYFKSNGAEK
jgi:ankyrin repeat protein